MIIIPILFQVLTQKKELRTCRLAGLLHQYPRYVWSSDVAFVFLPVNSERSAQSIPSYLESTEQRLQVHQRYRLFLLLVPTVFLRFSNPPILSTWVAQMKVSKARGWFKNPSLRFSYLYHLVLEQLGADIFLLPANYPNKNTSKVIDIQTESNNGSV